MRSGGAHGSSPGFLLLSRETVWESYGDPPESFSSPTRGGAQRLANGNTLITESERGRVFEITNDGELVWEFFNPMARGLKRVAIHRMMRIEYRDSLWVAVGFQKAPGAAALGERQASE